MSKTADNASVTEKTYVKCIKCGSYYEINSVHCCISGFTRRDRFSIAF